jgi:RHS repeat-associated protein
VDYAYDVNPAEPGFSQNGWGRLTAVGFHNEQQNGRESFNYQYSYDTAGHVVKQRLQMWAQPGSRPDANHPGYDLPVNFDATYGWDNEGRMSSLGYPADQNGNPGPTDSFTYDAMGRLNNYGATWGPAGELLSFDNGQQRTYNSLGQLESITVPGKMDMHYFYTTGQNNGRVAQTVDGITHETVNYTYDQLNRLSTAQASNGSWGQIYSYDGWGNLNSKAPYGGQGPTYSATPDPRYNGGADPTVTDWLYATDVEDRPIGTQPVTGYGQSFTYDQAGKMVFTLAVSSLPLDESGNPAGNYPCEVRFYGINGQRLAAYSCFYSLGGGNTGFQYSLKEYDHKIAGILTEWGGKYLATDRLGSIRADYSGGQYSYYPYGEAKTAPTGQMGLYADLEDPVRGYDSYAGRWSKPDPLGMRAAVLTNPITWNRYAYANGDPVNFNDRHGLRADGVANGLGPCGTDGGQVLCDMDSGVPGGSGPGNDPTLGGGTCILDGVDTPCSIVNSLRNSGNAMTPSEYAHEQYLAGLPVAEAALQRNDCAGLFNLPNGASPLSMLNDPRVVVTYNQYPELYTDAQMWEPGDDGNPVAGKYVINFNSLPGGRFSTSSPSETANTIIHELLHVAYSLYGANAVTTQWIQGDNGDYWPEMSNNNLVVTNCGVGQYDH